MRTVNSDKKDGFGTYVKVEHHLEIKGLPRTITTIYAHLALNSISVSRSDSLTRGQVIGLMGNTGFVISEVGQGHHLHIEARYSCSASGQPCVSSLSVCEDWKGGKSFIDLCPYMKFLPSDKRATPQTELASALYERYFF